MFCPKTFLEVQVDEKARTEMHCNMEMAFGHGWYMCADKLMAAMELNEVIFEVHTCFSELFIRVLRTKLLMHSRVSIPTHFDTQTVDPAKSWEAKSWPTQHNTAVVVSI